jgi:hypothetical protein
MNETNYQGRTNRATWTVFHQLTADEVSGRWTAAAARRAAEKYRSTVDGTNVRRRFDDQIEFGMVVDELSDWIRYYCGDKVDSYVDEFDNLTAMGAELLRVAIGQVDWHDIARALLEDELG